ncbi:hypothetical protein R3P38DRAFT_3151543, partial [Favolaschia claudopus]
SKFQKLRRDMKSGPPPYPTSPSLSSCAKPPQTRNSWGKLAPERKFLLAPLSMMPTSNGVLCNWQLTPWMEYLRVCMSLFLRCLPVCTNGMSPRFGDGVPHVTCCEHLSILQFAECFSCCDDRRASSFLFNSDSFLCRSHSAPSGTPQHSGLRSNEGGSVLSDPDSGFDGAAFFHSIDRPLGLVYRVTLVRFGGGKHGKPGHTRANVSFLIAQNWKNRSFE